MIYTRADHIRNHWLLISSNLAYSQHLSILCCRKHCPHGERVPAPARDLSKFTSPASPAEAGIASQVRRMEWHGPLPRGSPGGAGQFYSTVASERASGPNPQHCEDPVWTYRQLSSGWESISVDPIEVSLKDPFYSAGPGSVLTTSSRIISGSFLFL